MRRVEEDEIVRRLRAGDRTGFAEVVRRHRDAIFRVVRGHVKSDAEAEDLTQQTFLQALRAIGGFRGEASLGTWLHRIAVNAALNHARDQKRARAGPLEEGGAITNAPGTRRPRGRRG